MDTIRPVPAILAAGLLAWMAAANPASGGGEPEVDKRLAPFVPSPMEIVAKMLEMAEVGPDDVVYDLGCGDGRIVIAAAKRYGARGVGVDLDPERLAESREGAAQGEVEERIEFRLGDALETDVSPATVVALYLLPDGLVRLKSLLGKLQPGARVVSHNYEIAGWRASRIDHVKDGRGWDHVVFLYRIEDRSDATGTWSWIEDSGRGSRARWSARLVQDGAVLAGTVRGPAWEGPISGGTVEGDRISFRASIPLEGGEIAAVFEGKWDGDLIGGTVAVDGDRGSSRKWTPRREIPRPTGIWEWTEETPTGPARTSLEVRREGWKLSAKYGRGPVGKVEARGARIRFEADVTLRTVHGIRQVRRSYSGIIDGDAIEGTCICEGETVPWKGVRAAAPAGAPENRKARPAAEAKGEKKAPARKESSSKKKAGAPG